MLDTWFSSSLWPFSTLGWPDETPELRRWYPTTCLVTGFDIIFFWVARMMMMGIHFLGVPPFSVVYLHPLVRDAQGRKMSKSLGNGIDPIAMIEKYGCDSLRFTLTVFAAMGRDIRLSEERIEGYRHFVNKVWNAARFAMLNLEDNPPRKIDLASVEQLPQIWILDRLEGFKLDMANALAEYRFSDAAQCAYKFVWNEFCDWYLELAKPALQSEEAAIREPARYVLWLALREILVLLHPVMPFVTAEIWQALPAGPDASRDIALELYPVAHPEASRPEKAREMEVIQSVIVAARTIKAELDISPSKKIALILHPDTDEQEKLLEANRQSIMILARLESLTIDRNVAAPKASASSVANGCQVIVPLEGAVNLQDELARLEKELAKINNDLVDANKKLHNESFTRRAPTDVVARERERAERLLDARTKLEARKHIFTEAMQEE